MEICHAFKKSNLHKFGVFIAFVDIVAPMNGDIFGQQVTSKVRIQSQALFLESSECLHSVFCSVPMSSKQPHCSPRLLTRFKLKSYCTVTRKMQLGLVTCQNKQQKGINVSWGLHVLHMFLKVISRQEAHGFFSWIIFTLVFTSALKCRYKYLLWKLRLIHFGVC